MASQPGTQTDSPDAVRLDSWKQIAAYLNRDPRTVQRWESEEGLPVHRQLHSRQGSVYAFTAELDAWWKSRTRHPETDPSGPQSPAANLPAAEPNGSTDMPPQAIAPWRRLTPWLVVAGVIAMASSLAFALKVRRAHGQPVGVNPAAYEAYQRGREAWNQRTPSGYGYAMEYFNQAIKLDPSYAEAYSGLADSYALLASGGEAPYSEAYPKAREMAEKAIALNDRIAEAHASLAFVEAFYDWKFAEADKQFRKGIQINPDYVDGHHWFGMYLSLTGRNAEAIAELEVAVKLDPKSTMIRSDLGDAYRRAGLYEYARAAYSEAVRIDPKCTIAINGIGMTDSLEGRIAEAEVDRMRLKRISGDARDIESEIVVAYAKAGRLDRAVSTFKDIEREASMRGAPVPCVAEVYLALGDKEKALGCLEQAVQERADWIIQINANPGFGALRNDPRFQDLVRRVGAP